MEIYVNYPPAQQGKKNDTTVKSFQNPESHKYRIQCAKTAY